jgi:hypothetical protein
VKAQRQAKAWLIRMHESVERAREHIGSHLRKVSGLNLVRYCRHDGPPGVSRPCEEQAHTAIQRACRAWEASRGRIRKICDVPPRAAGRSIRGMVPVEAPAASSEFPPDLIDSEGDSDSSKSEDSDSSGSDTEDSDSSETGAEDSAPSDAEMEDQGPFASDTDDSDSSSTDTEDSDSSGSDSGYARPSSADTGGEVSPSAPPLEEIEVELEGVIAGLRGRAMQQVRRFVAVLAQMRKDLTPSTRTQMIKELGWHLGPNHGTGGAGGDGSESEPTWLLEGTGWIMSRLATIREQKHQAQVERFRAMQEKMAMLDDGLACAEERLAEKRAAELKERAKEIERRLPIITTWLGILWSEVTGSSRPVPSEMQLTSTGAEMIAEEHVVTAETHLRYAKGHLQPSEEHLADAEVHLKLVKAHLAVLETVEQAEADSLEMAAPPSPESPAAETCAVSSAPRKVLMRRAKMASAEGKGCPSGEPEVELTRKGKASLKGGRRRPPLKQGRKGTCPVNECRESATHPLDNCKGFQGLSITKRRKMLREWSRCECCLRDCRDRETGARCYRRIGFRRHHLLRLAVQQEATSTPDSERQEERS